MKTGLSKLHLAMAVLIPAITLSLSGAGSMAREDEAPFPEDGIKRHPAAFPMRCLDRITPDTTYRVEIRFDVRQDGTTENVEVLKSDSACLNSNAVRSVEKWQYDTTAFDLPLEDQTTTISFKIS